MQKKSLSNYYILNVNERVKQFNEANTQVNAYWQEKKGANRMLFEFKNILENKLRSSFEDVQSNPKYLAQHLPFVFSVYSLPLQMVISLAAAQVKGPSTQIEQVVKQLKQVDAQTIYHEAGNCVYNSITFGSWKMGIAAHVMKNQQSLLASVKDGLQKAMESTLEKFKSFSKKIGNLLRKNSQTPSQKIGDIVEAASFRNTVVVKNTGQKIIEGFAKTLKVYGNVILDYDFITSYALRTKSYGQVAYYIPGIEMLLFTLKNGIPKVYLKTNNQISLIQQSQFTYDFLANIVRSLFARQNADIISQYNQDVSLQKKQTTFREDFKFKLQTGFYVNERIIDANKRMQEKIDAQGKILESLATSLSAGSSKTVQNQIVATQQIKGTQ